MVCIHPPQPQEGPFHPSHTAEYVAQRILERIASEEAEIFAHECMKSLG